MGRLDGKVAIITGAASGMGLADVMLFAKEGAKVIAGDIQFELLQKRIHELNYDKEEVLAVKLDVTLTTDWKAVVEQAIDAYGRIDILVNNAGVLKIDQDILNASLDDWNFVMSVNATSVFLGMKEVIPVMQKIGGGSIINISSIGAIVGGADGNNAAYAASKGAVRSLTKHAALRYAKDQIRVNSIHPGATITGMSKSNDTDRFKGIVPLPPYAGVPEDIANGVLYLASDESRFVTGEELVIDGGWVIK